MSPGLPPSASLANRFARGVGCWCCCVALAGAATLRQRERSFGFPTSIPAFPASAPAALSLGAPREQAGKASGSVALAAGERQGGARGGAAQQPPGGFQQFYQAYAAGPGIWKWSNALDAYQRHLAPMASQPLKLAEVGVQSGGSCVMWKAVLGPQCHVYGIDINPATSKFQDATTTISIGDQADPVMWQNFFASTTMSPIDALIDDGGHEAHQMLVTLTSVFDHLTAGGMIAIEDIHGEHYVQSFFAPSAQYLGSKAAQGLLSSVHIYPFLLVAVRAGNDLRAPVMFAGSTETVADFAGLWQALARHPGGHVVLENPGWGSFLTAQGLTNFFQVFGQLHHSEWHDEPAGCESTPAPVCSVIVHNAPMQATITGVHVFATRLVVEVAGAPVALQAVRHGTDWLPY